MSDRVIRTEKHGTVVEAPPYRYVPDDRPGGNALVEQAYDPRCPRCREEGKAARRTEITDCRRHVAFRDVSTRDNAPGGKRSSRRTALVTKAVTCIHSPSMC